MKYGEKKILAELEDICNKLNITLRYEKTTAKGGLCLFENKYHIIIDKKASYHYKIKILTESLGEFDLSDLHISPKVRELIENEKH
jgi:hypothetical protein